MMPRRNMRENVNFLPEAIGRDGYYCFLHQVTLKSYQTIQNIKSVCSTMQLEYEINKLGWIFSLKLFKLSLQIHVVFLKDEINRKNGCI